MAHFNAEVNEVLEIAIFYLKTFFCLTFSETLRKDGILRGLYAGTGKILPFFVPEI